MENLFSTTIAIENENVNYHVFFDNEKYVFQSQSGKAYPTFSLKREHDEWHNQEFLPSDLKEQAIDALEKYLFKQH